VESPKRESASALGMPNGQQAPRTRRGRKARRVAFTHRRGPSAKRTRAGSMGHLTIYSDGLLEQEFRYVIPASAVPTAKRSSFSFGAPPLRVEQPWSAMRDGKVSGLAFRLEVCCLALIRRASISRPRDEREDRGPVFPTRCGTLDVQGGEREGTGDRSAAVRSYQYVCGTNCCSDMAGRTYVGSNCRRGILSFLGV